MSRFHTVAVIATLAALSTASRAQNDDHKAHHPAGAASSAAAPAAAAVKPAGMPDMAMMDKHMKAMMAMHQKMERASTPAERQALMAEHMKLMQEGMSMMAGMGAGADPAVRKSMMDNCMAMMRTMERMPMSSNAPGK